MAGNPVQLREDHPDRLRPGRRLDVQQLLHGQAIAQTVGDRSHIVHPVHIRIELRVRPVFGNLLHAAVQITDDAFGPQDLLPVQLEDHAQHPVSGGMLRAHVENQFRGV